MRILLLQLDGALPNIALMRTGAHHRALGDEVELRRAGNPTSLQPQLGDRFDRVYASLIFTDSRPLAKMVKRAYPDALIGGTGWDLTTKIEDYGITTREQDYSLYPRCRFRIGRSHDGCTQRCDFCVVPQKEGRISNERSLLEIWGGEPNPRRLVLLDNDFFGTEGWPERIEEAVEHRLQICMSQGFNVRKVRRRQAEAIARVDCRDVTFKHKRIYCAWDNRRDEVRLFDGLNALVEAGINPRNIMVYMLVGHEPGETHELRDHRRAKLREFGVLPYPMPFVRTRELVRYQAWVIGGYDKSIPWDEWMRADGRPEKLQRRPSPTLRLPVIG